MIGAKITVNPTQIRVTNFYALDLGLVLGLGLKIQGFKGVGF